MQNNLVHQKAIGAFLLHQLVVFRVLARLEFEVPFLLRFFQESDTMENAQDRLNVCILVHVISSFGIFLVVL